MKRQLVGLQEGLLRGPVIGPVKSGPTSHAAQYEDLQLLTLVAELGLGLVPVDLGFLPPGIALGHESLTGQQSQG